MGQELICDDQEEKQRHQGKAPYVMIIKGDLEMVMEEEEEEEDHHHYGGSGVGYHSVIDGVESPPSSSLSGSAISSSLSQYSSEDDHEFDDASSSSAISSSSSSSRSNEALFDLSELMAQLPVKRGLSKFYHGKSESFTSLSRATSLEDLAKKARQPYRRKHKTSAYTRPKPTIAKKSAATSSRASSLSLSLSLSCLSGGTRGRFVSVL